MAAFDVTRHAQRDDGKHRSKVAAHAEHERVAGSDSRKDGELRLQQISDAKLGKAGNAERLMYGKNAAQTIVPEE